MANNISSAFTRPIDKRYFWTDNTCVRNWIRSTSLHYKTYVANRIGEIQRLTSPIEWRHLRGDLNPSDIATRSSYVFAKNRDPIDTWIKGPEFLYTSEHSWPKDTSCEEERHELRKEYEGSEALILVTATDATETFDWTTVEFQPEAFTTYTTLTEHLLELLRRCQHEIFSNEITRLKKGKELYKESISFESLSSRRSITQTKTIFRPKPFLQPLRPNPSFSCDFAIFLLSLSDGSLFFQVKGHS